MAREARTFFRCRRELGVRDADDRHYPAVTAAGTVRLEQGEILLWRGRADTAECLYNDAMDGHAVRWRLPGADVVVTDRRVAFVAAAADGCSPVAVALRTGLDRLRSNMSPRFGGVSTQPVPPGRSVPAGQVRWQWPYWLHAVPAGENSLGLAGPRPGRPSRIVLVCTAYRAGGHPALVLAGGDISEVAAADRLADAIRVAVARFRRGRAGALGISRPEIEALGARVSGPRFGNDVGGPGQGTNLPGALMVGFLRHDEYRQADAPLLASPGGGLSLRHLARA